MLESLRLEDVGPAPSMELSLAPRVNLVTGDNGLGKSFLLDVAWWSLTRTWARALVRPHSPPSTPRISYQYRTQSGRPHRHTSEFDRGLETWTVKPGRPPIPGLVIYAQVDGGFSVWDPARNYWKGQDPDRPSAYLFSPEEVWDGLPLDEPVKFCNGLITDWTNWQLENGQSFDQLTRVLAKLAPSPDEPLAPGQPAKLSLRDARKHPTLQVSYGLEVPLVHASAGIRRVVSLAYLLVWTWQEHLASAKLRGDEPAREVIFLIDEIESHLHPQWQRRIVPALLDVMDALTGQQEVPVQLVTTTHSPLVLASMEPRFEPDRDAWFDLDLEGEPPEVHLRKRTYTPRGSAGYWLTSEAFDLPTDRGSLEAERAILRARDLLRMRDPGLDEVMRAHQDLRAVLPDVDRFWVRWNAFVERRGGEP